eukprot:TRINITY_DN972_c0_g1_i3.p1 TRINITY_DN972_c0_g1~~TRINITY_DN972_c0_g1_i3.p1  ORF type:complete len:137 (-),score=22.97 TRINITY_DN972_c0_g1_i3:388-798(-)
MQAVSMHHSGQACACIAPLETLRSSGLFVCPWLLQQALTGIAKGNATQLSIRALKDALSLLSTQVVTQTALLDLMALFAAALQEPGARKKKTLALVAKRLEYFTAWARTDTGYKAIEAEQLDIAKELAHAEALGGT